MWAAAAAWSVVFAHVVVCLVAVDICEKPLSVKQKPLIKLLSTRLRDMCCIGAIRASRVSEVCSQILINPYLGGVDMNLNELWFFWLLKRLGLFCCFMRNCGEKLSTNICRIFLN